MIFLFVFQCIQVMFTQHYIKQRWCHVYKRQFFLHIFYWSSIANIQYNTQCSSHQVPPSVPVTHSPPSSSPSTTPSSFPTVRSLSCSVSLSDISHSFHPLCFHINVRIHLSIFNKKTLQISIGIAQSTLGKSAVFIILSLTDHKHDIFPFI